MRLATEVSTLKSQRSDYLSRLKASDELLTQRAEIQAAAVTYDNLTLTAEKVQGRRIAKVLITRNPPDEAPQEQSVGR